MTERNYNFSPGPAVLPESVLAEARENLLSLGSTGIGVMEHSHRGQAFSALLAQAEADCRTLADIPDNYRVLFLQGGASTQFFQVPMSFLTAGDTADYLVTGSWSEKAIKQANRFGDAHVACDSKGRNHSYIPETVDYSARPTYVHYTSNNTIFGTQFRAPPQPPGDAFLVCDASSDIFSRPIDISRFGLIYAGSQKNLGPAGVTLVIIRDDLVKSAALDIPEMLQYRTHAENDSCYNTPPTFVIYMMGLVFKWLLAAGGLVEIGLRNEKKAAKLYRYIDDSPLFRGTADRESRSLMNVTFVTGNDVLDKRFISFARERGLDGLKGHRSVGGMRASIYNAFPVEGVDALVAAMREFEQSAGGTPA